MLEHFCGSSHQKQVNKVYLARAAHNGAVYDAYIDEETLGIVKRITSAAMQVAHSFV